jgi:hypothetical protein
MIPSLDDGSGRESTARNLLHRCHGRLSDPIPAQHTDRVLDVSDNAYADCSTRDGVLLRRAIPILNDNPEEAVVLNDVFADSAAVRAQQLVDAHIVIGDVVFFDLSGAKGQNTDRLHLGYWVLAADRQRTCIPTDRVLFHPCADCSAEQDTGLRNRAKGRRAASDAVVDNRCRRRRPSRRCDNFHTNVQIAIHADIGDNRMPAGAALAIERYRGWQAYANTKASNEACAGLLGPDAVT